MKPASIQRGQLWREKRGSRELEVLANDGREVGAWIELRDTVTGAVYPKRWHRLVREFELKQERA